MRLAAPWHHRMRRFLFALPLLAAIALLSFAWSRALQDQRTDVVQVCVGLAGCGQADQASDTVELADEGNDPAPSAALESADTPASTVEDDDEESPTEAAEAGNAIERSEAETASDTAGSGNTEDAEPTTTATTGPSQQTADAQAGDDATASTATAAPDTSATPDPSATPRVVRGASPSATAPPSVTATPRPGTTPTPTPTSVAPSRTQGQPTATATSAPEATSTQVPTATSSPRPTATRAPVATPTPTPAPPATPTSVPSPTPLPSPTATSVPTPTQTPVPAPSGPQPVGQPGNWNLIFEDNFDIVDRSMWETAWFSSSGFTPSVNNNGGACFHPGQVSAIGGQIEMRIDPTTDERCRLKNGDQADYVGALINTRQSFTFSYGYAEARMFLPGSGGSLHNWPAFWHTGFDWPATGEVDIVEGLSGGQPCSVYHYEQGGAHQQHKSCVNWSDPTGWHVFAADWQPGRITFYYDGVEVFQTTQGVVGAPHYLILDYTLRANGIGTSVPSSMLVDYVRVWTSE